MDDKPAPDDGDAARPGSRFPCVQMVFLLACLAMAAWTWMRYSYCWKMPLAGTSHFADGGGMLHRYVEVAGAACGSWRMSGTNDPGLGGIRLRDPSAGYSPDSRYEMLVALYRSEEDAQRHWIELESRYGGGRWKFRGRVLPRRRLIVDATASRWHGASVAGLAVGAMGAFVFALYLRRWLRERRAAPELEASSDAASQGRGPGAGSHADAAVRTGD